MHQKRCKRNESNQTSLLHNTACVSFHSTESDTSSVAMGIMIALLSLVLLIVCIVFLLFCAYYHYVFNQIAQNKKKIDAEYNMVPRPEPTYVNATPVPEPLYVNTAGRDHDQ